MIKIIFALLFLVVNLGAHAEKQYLLLPDGTYYPALDGESPRQAWLRAQAKYPEAFGLKVVPEDKKYDLDYLNECKSKAAKETKMDKALPLAIESCKFKSIPKKCRSFSIVTDPIGNEKGDERVRCVEECAKANLYSKSVGECSKG